MASNIQKGYLVLADISGYTFFLANTELDHAQIVISYLLEAMVEKLGTALTISKLEGDAVFAYVEESKLPNGESLMELIDQTYFVFRDKVETMYKGASCSCRACRTINTLDLKFMVHHGDFIVLQVAGIKDAWGSDVNLLHRLLKNGVVEATGWRGYALFTSQGLQGIQPDEKSFIQQNESYEHLGNVKTYIMDMDARYQAMKAS
ncbi:MAG TPA: DUF2652 domain-containing protein [Nitrososphaera sp.]|nr:DUF2652 domain-containing protein [Nitrososphaera sp.]